MRVRQLENGNFLSQAREAGVPEGHQWIPTILLFLSEFNLVCVCGQLLSHVRLFVTLWTLARQAILSMGFFRQEYLNGLPFPSPGDLPDPRIRPVSPALLMDSLATESLILEYGNKAEMIQNV